jgi:hypothetical protein
MSTWTEALQLSIDSYKQTDYVCTLEKAMIHESTIFGVRMGMTLSLRDALGWAIENNARNRTIVVSSLTNRKFPEYHIKIGYKIRVHGRRLRHEIVTTEGKPVIGTGILDLPYYNDINRITEKFVEEQNSTPAAMLS